MRTIQARLAVAERRGPVRDKIHLHWEKYRSLPMNELQESLRSELARREYIHRRAQAFLGSIAVMTAFTIGATNSLRTAESVLPLWLITPAILVAFLYLAGGGWYALATIKPGLMHDLSLQTRMDGDSLQNDSLRQNTLLSLIHMSQAQNLIFNVLAERMSRCVRNGFLLLGVVLLLIVIDATLTRAIGRDHALWRGQRTETSVAQSSALARPRADYPSRWAAVQAGQRRTKV